MLINHEKWAGPKSYRGVRQKWQKQEEKNMKGTTMIKATTKATTGMGEIW